MFLSISVFMNVCVLHVCLSAIEVRRSFLRPLEMQEVRGSCGLSYECWRPNLGVLHKQPMLLIIKPNSQPESIFFLNQLKDT